MNEWRLLETRFRTVNGCKVSESQLRAAVCFVVVCSRSYPLANVAITRRTLRPFFISSSRVTKLTACANRSQRDPKASPKWAKGDESWSPQWCQWGDRVRKGDQSDPRSSEGLQGTWRPVSPFKLGQ